MMAVRSVLCNRSIASVAMSSAVAKPNGIRHRHVVVNRLQGDDDVEAGLMQAQRAVPPPPRHTRHSSSYL